MEFPRALDPFRAISAAWRILTAATGPILVGGILLTICSGGGPDSQIVFTDHDGRWEREIALPLFGFACCFGLVFLVLSSWLSIGYARAVEETARTGTTSFNRVFDSDGRFVDMLLARLLSTLLSIVIALPFGLIALASYALHEGLDAPEGLVVVLTIGSALAYLPIAIYFWLGLFFVTQAVALDNRSPMDALARSWELARGRRLSLAAFWFVTAIFSAIGICLCCVGVFLTTTLAIVATNEAYLELTRGSDELRAWWIRGPRRVEFATTPAGPPAGTFGGAQPPPASMDVPTDVPASPPPPPPAI